MKSPGEAPDLRGTMEIQVGLSFITSISHSVNSQVCKDCNGGSGGENKCKKKKKKTTVFTEMWVLRGTSEYKSTCQAG